MPAGTEAEHDSLFGASEIPVAPVGISYSANESWDFSAALQIALQADVPNAADEGGRPVAPMGDYLVGDDFPDTPPRLTVREIPERFPGVTCSEAAFKMTWRKF